MRRRRTDETQDEEAPLPPHGSAPPPEPGNTATRMPCPGCNTPTLGTELAQFGNRCSSCYAAFCRADQRTRSADLPDKRSHGNLAWAHAIVERHRQGQSITPAQLQMAQDAIRARPSLSFGEDDQP